MKAICGLYEQKCSRMQTPIAHWKHQQERGHRSDKITTMQQRTVVRGFAAFSQAAVTKKPPRPKAHVKVKRQSLLDHFAHCRVRAARHIPHIRHVLHNSSILTQTICPENCKHKGNVFIWAEVTNVIRICIEQPGPCETKTLARTSDAAGFVRVRCLLSWPSRKVLKTPAPLLSCFRGRGSG